MSARASSGRGRAQQFPVLRWLQVGAASAGVGVALIATAAVAAAEDTTGGSSVTGSSSPSQAASAGADTTTGSATDPDTAGSSSDGSPEQALTVTERDDDDAGLDSEISDAAAEELAAVSDSEPHQGGSEPETPAAEDLTQGLAEDQGGDTSEAGAVGVKEAVRESSSAPQNTGAEVAVSEHTSEEAADTAPAQAVIPETAPDTSTSPDSAVEAAVVMVEKAVNSPLRSAAAVSDAPAAATAAVSQGEYPDWVSAPVTWRSIVVEALSWTLGISDPAVPIRDSPVPDWLSGLWTGVRKLHYTFFNSAPTLNPTEPVEDADSLEITGSLGGFDADGDEITYTVLVAPKYGTLEIGSVGNYSYIPDEALATSGVLDSFTVLASDTSAANPWHVNPLGRLVAGVSQLLSRLGLPMPPWSSVASVEITLMPCPVAVGEGRGCSGGGADQGDVFAPYVDMGSIAQRELTWYMNDSTDPTKPGNPSLVATMDKTGIQAATLAFVNQQGAGGAYVWGSSTQPAANTAFDSAKGAQIKNDVQAAVGKGLKTIVSFGGITAAQNGVEIGQLNGRAVTTKSDQVAGSGQTSVSLTLAQPIDFDGMEAGSIAGRFTINDAVTELYQVDRGGKFTFSHQVTYEVPKAIGGSVSDDGRTITIKLDKPLQPNQGKAATVVSYGLQEGFDQMKQAYEGAIQYFYNLGIRHFDLDIEGPALSIDQWGINNQRIRVFKAFQDENTFPGMELSFVLPIGPNTGWHPVTDPGRLIQAAGQAGLDVATWNMMAFDYGPQTYQYMLAHDKDMVDMLIGEADTGITVDPNFPIKGAVDYLVDFGLAKDRQEAFQKLGVTLMIGQDDTVYVHGATPEGYAPGDAAVVEAIDPEEVGSLNPEAMTVLKWAEDNGVKLLSFWSLGRDRPSFNTTAYNPTLAVTYQTGSPAAPTVETNKVAGGSKSSVALPFQASTRTIMSGNLYNANSEWLGTFQIEPNKTVKFSYVPQRVVKPVGGNLDTTNGILNVNFSGGVTDTVWAKLDYQPKILVEYQDKDLVYTDILNKFDD